MEAKKITGSLSKYLPVPGDTIKELLDSNNISQSDLALRIGMSKKHINQLIKGKKRITTETSSKLSKVFPNLKSSFWDNLQQVYDELIQKIKDQESITEDEKEIVRKLPYDCLLKWGYFDIEKPTIEKKIDLFRCFLQVSDVRNAPRSFNAPDFEAFRKSSKTHTDPYIMSIWIQMCLKSDRKDTIPFSKSKLKSVIPLVKGEIIKNNINEEMKDLKNIFSSCGISFSVIHNLAGAPVQGYMRLINSHILLCVTLRQKFEDIFWFTILHEIGHLLNNHISVGGVIDYNDSRSSFFSSEEEADDFASNCLISADAYNSAFEYSINEENILKLSKQSHVTPGIVVGRLGHKNPLYFQKFGYLRKTLDWA